jgi:hypothetical protein
MAGLDDLVGDIEPATTTLGNPVDRSLSHARPQSKRRFGPVDRFDVLAQSHTDTFSGKFEPSKAKSVFSLSLVGKSYSFPLSTRASVADMTDEQIAIRVLGELFPKGSRADGARETGIPEKTFTRMCKGGAIKGANMALLLSYDPFAEAFRRLKKESEPQIDPRSREAVARLAAAVGPRTLKELVFEIESLATILGPARAVAAIERLTETARDVSDSIKESRKRQKRS